MSRGRRPHKEHHLTSRIGWLRAAVLGANDGIISVSSLIVGVASSSAGRSGVLLSGIAALVAGAMSMAAGEYVSVSSQADAEAADLLVEQRELHDDPKAEHAELAAIYVGRGLSAELADQVADQLTAADALAAHARDELGLSATTQARPVQAALASAAAFTSGAIVPVIAGVLLPRAAIPFGVSLVAVFLLAVLGAIGAAAGGAGRAKAVLRVTFWGAAALAATAAIGHMTDASI